MLSFLASSTFFKYAQNEGFASKKFKFSWGGGACPQTPQVCSDRFAIVAFVIFINLMKKGQELQDG
jgi:hypothetical protein